MSWLRSLAVLAMALALCLGASPALASSFRTADITVRDGVVLTGNVFVPDTPGPHPAIVFITSWATPNIEYLAQAWQLAEDGYVVLSYTPRGFYFSGGFIETAGPKDVGDISEVIDWLLRNTPADPARIGAAGISYGAGLSLLGSAFDSRIRAVAGQPYTVDTAFPATAYDVPAGNRLTLVIDTVDPLYADEAPLFTTVRLSSPAGNPSYVSRPLK